MLGKRTLPEAPSEEKKRLRVELLDLFISNALSAPRLHSLASACQAAGAQGIQDVVERSGGPNPQRDLERLALQASKWPPLYEVAMPARTVSSEAEVSARLYVLLPHELLAVLVEHSDAAQLLLCQRNHVRQHRPDLLHLPADQLLVGLWQDGVPFNHNREHSLELWCLNLIGHSALRLPLTGWPKDLQTKVTTHDAFFDLMRWSFGALATGTFPSQRHDGEAFQERWRVSRAGKPLGFLAGLAEMRGDWSMFKSVLALPGWQDSGAICWRCHCTKADLCDVGANAAWRRENLDHNQFEQRQTQAGKRVSHFFQIPGASIHTVKVDFLHTCDLGCTADFFGNYLWYITMKRVQGPNHAARCEHLFQTVVLPYYKREGTESRLPCLRPTMLKKEKGTFKLRAKAGEARALVGLIPELSRQYLRQDNAAEALMGYTGEGLTRLYGCLHRAKWQPHKFEAAAIDFLKGYAALSTRALAQGDTKSWRLKPKSHQLLELARSQVNPVQTWCYRDESNGGYCADLTARRGGSFTMGAVSRALLLRFCGRECVPRL